MTTERIILGGPAHARLATTRCPECDVIDGPCRVDIPADWSLVKVVLTVDRGPIDVHLPRWDVWRHGLAR